MLKFDQEPKPESEDDQPSDHDSKQLAFEALPLPAAIAELRKAIPGIKKGSWVSVPTSRFAFHLAMRSTTEAFELRLFRELLRPTVSDLKATIDALPDDWVIADSHRERQAPSIAGGMPRRFLVLTIRKAAPADPTNRVRCSQCGRHGSSADLIGDVPLCLVCATTPIGS